MTFYWLLLLRHQITDNIIIIMIEIIFKIVWVEVVKLFFKLLFLNYYYS